MRKNVKTTLYILFGIIVLLIVGGGAGSIILKNKIKKSLEEDLPENVELTYDELKIKVLSGSMRILNPNLRMRNKENNQEHTIVLAKDLQINEFSYWKYLFSKTIKIEEIILDDPELVYHKDKVEKADKSQKKDDHPFKNVVLLEKIKLLNGNFTIVDKEKDSIFLYSQNMTMKVENVKISNSIFLQKIPFEYSDVLIQGDSLFVKAGIYENVALKKFEIDNHNSTFNDIHFYTKYSIQKLNQIIPYERDHYELKVKSVKIHEYDYGFSNKDSLFVASKKLEVSTPQFDIYRDKTVKKDTTFKPLYNRSLRELPFDLSLDSLIVLSANIKYTERHKTENFGGEISFKDLNANIANVGNTFQNPIHANIEAFFMDTTPFAAEWELQVHDLQDDFIFRAEVQRLNASDMNRFVTPNLSAELEGEATHTFFTIDGNNESSKTDVKIKYQGLKVGLLNQNDEKREVVSSLVNVIIPKESKEKGTEFNDGTGTVDRHKTQSVFNQLWISLESALKDAMLPKVVKKITE